MGSSPLRTSSSSRPRRKPKRFQASSAIRPEEPEVQQRLAEVATARRSKPSRRRTRPGWGRGLRPGLPGEGTESRGAAPNAGCCAYTQRVTCQVLSMRPMKAVPEPAERPRPSFHALARLVEWIAPWLVAVGSWVFGGLLALNLVLVAALITVGPADRSALIATLAFACALPFDVAGLVLLRLTKDLQDVRLDDLALKAFQEARFPSIEAYFPPEGERKSYAKRRALISLAYAWVIAMLTTALTIAGLAASLWHMAPWVGGVFLATVALSALILVAAAAHSLPPQSEAEKELKKREAGR